MFRAADERRGKYRLHPHVNSRHSRKQTWVGRRVDGWAGVHAVKAVGVASVDESVRLLLFCYFCTASCSMHCFGGVTRLLWRYRYACMRHVPGFRAIASNLQVSSECAVCVAVFRCDTDRLVFCFVLYRVVEPPPAVRTAVLSIRWYFTA